MGNHNINRDLNKTTYTMKSNTNYAYNPVFLGGFRSLVLNP